MSRKQAGSRAYEHVSSMWGSLGALQGDGEGDGGRDRRRRGQRRVLCRVVTTLGHRGHPSGDLWETGWSTRRRGPTRGTRELGCASSNPYQPPGHHAYVLRWFPSAQPLEEGSSGRLDAWTCGRKKALFSLPRTLAKSAFPRQGCAGLRSSKRPGMAAFSS